MRSFLSVATCGTLLLLAACSSAEPPYEPTDSDKRDYSVAVMNEFTRLAGSRPLNTSQEAQLRGMSLDKPELADIVDGGLEACTELREKSLRSLAADVEKVRSSASSLRRAFDMAGTDFPELDLLTDPLDRLDMASEHLYPDVRDRFFEVEELSY